MRGLLLLGLALVLLAAGCGGGNEAASTSTSTTTTTTTATQTTSVRVYFLRNGQVWPVTREVEGGQSKFSGSLGELVAGPTYQEANDLKLTTAMRQGSSTLVLVRQPGGLPGPATLQMTGTFPRSALAQAVYTLTQFPTVKSVEISGKRYTRADFETQTPPILVESPLSYQVVSSPLRVTGTANTFEATFQYELTDAEGKIISKHFEMATSGSGTRGTFDFAAPFTVDRDGRGKLTVYEDSAENGKRIHQQEIPLELKR